MVDDSTRDALERCEPIRRYTGSHRFNPPCMAVIRHFAFMCRPSNRRESIYPRLQILDDLFHFSISAFLVCPFFPIITLERSTTEKDHYSHQHRFRVEKARGSLFDNQEMEWLAQCVALVKETLPPETIITAEEEEQQARSGKKQGGGYVVNEKGKRRKVVGDVSTGRMVGVMDGLRLTRLCRMISLRHRITRTNNQTPPKPHRRHIHGSTLPIPFAKIPVSQLVGITTGTTLTLNPKTAVAVMLHRRRQGMGKRKPSIMRG